MSQLTGRMIGPYRVGRLIGEGGMSVVYEAVDTRSSQRIALKLLRLEHNQDPVKIERFWRGAQSAIELQHPHIVPVYDANLADGFYYIAMKLMEGGSVEELLGSGSLPPEQAARILSQIAMALDYAHSRQVFHRDIKPSNMLLSHDQGTAYLADFGVARVTGQETVTTFGTLIGTPEYMSPEQVQGHKIDGRTDIYSLGVTAYQLLTGQLPFQGEPTAVLYQHVHAEPPSVRRLNRAVSPETARAVQKAMAKDPDDRYGQATAFADALQHSLVRKPTRLSVWVALGVTALLVMLLAFVALSDDSSIITITPIADVVATEEPETAATQSGGVTVEATSTLSNIEPTSTTVAISESTSQEATATAIPVEPEPTVPPASPVPATAIPNTRSETIVILQPSDGVVIPLNEPRQTFSWQMGRPLDANERFEIRMADSEGIEQPLITFRETTVTDDFLQRLDPGQYRWQVVVIQTDQDGSWVADVAESAWFEMEWGR